MKASDAPDPMQIEAACKAAQAGVGPAAQTPKRPRHEWEVTWPAEVWSIGIDRVDLLGVDQQGNLYWDGHRVEVRRGLTLTRWQRIGAIVTAGGAAIGGIGAFATAVHDWWK